MNNLFQAYTEQLENLLTTEPRRINAGMVNAVSDRCDDLRRASLLFQDSYAPHVELLQDLFFQPGLPKDVTRTLMARVGCSLNHKHLKYESTWHNIANPEVFFPLLIEQHLGLNDYSLYRFMERTVLGNNADLFIKLAEKYLAKDASTHPAGFTEKVCAWTYALVLSSNVADQRRLNDLLILNQQKLLDGLTFKDLIYDYQALGKARHFKSIGLDALCERYALAQLSWPHTMEHFVVMDEIGHRVPDHTIKYLTAHSSGCKKFGAAALYYHLSNPGSPWYGFEIHKDDCPRVIARVANTLWKNDSLRAHITAFVNEFAGATSVNADDLLTNKLNPQIAKRCSALHAAQLERDLGL